MTAKASTPSRTNTDMRPMFAMPSSCARRYRDIVSAKRYDSNTIETMLSMVRYVVSYGGGRKIESEARTNIQPTSLGRWPQCIQGL